MLKRLKKLYIGNKDIKFIKNEIVNLGNEIKELRTLFKDDDKEYNRGLNKQITERYKTLFDLRKQIDIIRQEMFD